MKKKKLTILGLMSGTSNDGIDVSLVKSNGKQLHRLNKNYYYKYDQETKNKINQIIDNKNLIIKNEKKRKEANNFITYLHAKCILKTKFLDNCDLVGFHGHTLFHDPNNKRSIQLGNGSLLANILQKKVVFNFRDEDLKNNGQGAPLAPIYHKFLINELKLEKPSCVINIGGISNLTYWDGNNLIGFDCGPGNSLIDRFCQLKLNRNYDNFGMIALKGYPNKKLVNEFLSLEYFKKKFPKSLEKSYFDQKFQQLISSNLSTENMMATLSEITIRSIVVSIKSLPKKIMSLIICGGGSKNNYFTSKLNQELRIKIDNLDHHNISTDYIESELIAFLSARRIYNLPITFPSTTGCIIPSLGGKIFIYHKKPTFSLL